MARPSAVQLLTGTATVVLATLAVLLPTGASSPLAIGGIALGALALGLVVAVRLTPAAGGGRGVVGSTGVRRTAVGERVREPAGP